MTRALSNVEKVIPILYCLAIKFCYLFSTLSQTMWAILHCDVLFTIQLNCYKRTSSVLLLMRSDIALDLKTAAGVAAEGIGAAGIAAACAWAELVRESTCLSV